MSTDPITLRVSGEGDILDVALFAQTEATNAVSIALDPEVPASGATLTFEYLDPRQGAVLEVLHTAESPESVVVTGTIMGIPKGIIRVTESVEVTLPIGLAGAVTATVPMHTIPRSLRIASGTRTHRHFDLTIGSLVSNALRRLLP